MDDELLFDRSNIVIAAGVNTPASKLADLESSEEDLLRLIMSFSDIILDIVWCG